MPPIEERDRGEPTDFTLLELGEVSEQTQGLDYGIQYESGDAPFNRILCFPC